MGPLIFSMALPAMISMIINSLYNIVDSIFVAKYSQDALAAVSLVYPLQMLVVAIGVGTGVGVNSLIARRLGEKRQKHADSAAEHGVALAVVGGIAFFILGWGFSGVFVGAFGASEAVSAYAIQYSHLAVGMSIFVMISMMCEKIQQSGGNMIIPMCQGLTGAIINIILDPLMIFGIGPFPEMGVAGAAAATVIGQWVAGILGIILNAKKNPEIQVHLKEIFRPDPKIIGHIYAVGIPSIIMSAIGSVMTFGMDLILVGFTTTAVAVFGAYFKLQSFFFMPVFGMNNALVPIIAYNYGARKKARVIKTIKLGIRYAMCFMLVGMLLFELFPQVLLGMFSPSEDMLAIGIPALRKIAVHFPVAAVCIILITTLQALGKAMFSMLVSIGRQLVVLLPAAYILAKVGGLHVVWWSFPIAEAMSLALCTSFFLHVKRTIIDPLDHPVTADLQEVADRESVQC